MNEIKIQLQESYDIFLNKYNKKMLSVSKKNVDALYENTRAKLKIEESDYKNKKDKYSIYNNSDMCKTKYLAELNTIKLNNIRQMRSLVDEKYIQSILASEEVDEHIHVLMRSNRPQAIFEDDELAKIIKFKNAA
jgi:uncharacterized protein YeaO (DUF488 family)